PGPTTPARLVGPWICSRRQLLGRNGSSTNRRLLIRNLLYARERTSDGHRRPSATDFRRRAGPQSELDWWGNHQGPSRFVGLDESHKPCVGNGAGVFRLIRGFGNRIHAVL